MPGTGQKEASQRGQFSGTSSLDDPALSLRQEVVPSWARHFRNAFDATGPRERGLLGLPAGAAGEGVPEPERGPSGPTDTARPPRPRTLPAAKRRVAFPKALP